MTGPRPATPFVPRWLAVVGAMCLALGFAVAQPLNPQPATNSVGTNVAPPVLVTAASDTNFSLPTKLEREDFILATARYHANLHEFTDAEKEYVKLLGADTPESTQKSALFEMGGVVRNEGDYTRAAAIYTQYVQRWPEDSRIPELYLQQGRVFRDMGVPNMALAKFYGVMTTALALKSNQLDYYKHIVLEAQVEIADTHYQIGKFQDAVDYYSRLLTQNDPSLDREQIQFRLIRCLEAINRHDDAVTQAHDFLEHYPTSAEEPEVRYHLAQAYKAQNRTTEALQEVKTFLKEEHDKTTNDPAVWAYWQQRVGNEIGNQLYQEGDYVKALQVYLALSQLDPSAAWQLPVRYQVGLTYEKLLQPKLAMAAYRDILTNTVSGQTASLSPDLKSVVDMAGWRLQFLQWSDRAAPYVPAMAANTSTNLNANQP